MKKIILMLTAVLILASCASSQRFEYKSQQEEPLQAKEAYLEVRDNRTDKEILSPDVKEMKLWTGVGSVFTLVYRAAKKSEIPTTTTNVKGDFIDAMRSRMIRLGVRPLTQPDVDGTILTIEIEKISLDLQKSTFKAEIIYTASIFTAGDLVHSERVIGRIEKYNYYGKKSGEDTLNEAFSLAINNLNIKLLFNK